MPARLRGIARGHHMSISIRTIATLAVAVLFGLIAVLLVRSYLNNAVRPVVAQALNGPTVPVVVANRPLARGVALDPAFLKIVNYPQDGAPAQAFHSIADAAGAQGQPRLTLRNLTANEPVMATNVSGPGGKLNLSGTVAPGMRAVGLRSNDVAGVGGFVLPGDRVDILLTRSVGGGEHADTVTQTLAENVRVLGVDQSNNDQSDKPVVAKAITVEVTPAQAQSISLGQSVGTVSLSLRHVADDAPLAQKEKSMSVADLRVGPARPTSGPAEPGIRVVRGVSASRFSFSTGSALERAAAQAPAGVSAP
jgi:pilus assembly protein CpaB